MVAAVAYAAEGRIARGSGGLAVPVHNACANTQQEVVPIRLLATDQPSRQAVAGVVGKGQRLIPIRVAVDFQQRAEVLLVGHVQARHVDQRGAEQAGVLFEALHTVNHRAAHGFQFILGVEQAIGGGNADQAAIKRRWLLVELPRYVQLGDGIRKRIDEAVAYLALGHHQAAGAGAALPP